MKQIVVVAGGLAIALGAMLPARAQSSSNSGLWVGTWSTSVVGRPQVPPAPLPPGPPPFMANECPVAAALLPAAPPPVVPPAGQTFAPQPFVHFTNQTLRQIVHTSIGGSRARVMLSNALRHRRRSRSARRTSPRATMTMRSRAGRPSADVQRAPDQTIPANAVAYSDPVDAAGAAADRPGDRSVSAGHDQHAAPLTMHVASWQTNYISETGQPRRHGETADGRDHPQLVPAVARRGRGGRTAGAIVAFGDSITDGSASTPDTNSRWPDVLARRLAAAAPPVKMGVLNAGIGGNRVLSEAPTALASTRWRGSRSTC